jgi:hypothetical protein
MTFRLILEPRSPSGRSDTDLFAERAHAVAALEDIDARYLRDRDGIENWLGPEQSKARLLARLHARRLAEREPLVQWLLQLAQSGETSSR